MRASTSMLYGGVLTALLYAQEDTAERLLYGDMQENYRILPPVVEDASEIVAKGKWYGRLRMHGFGYVWDDASSLDRADHAVVGVGGSLIFKTATWQGVSATFGVYTSTAFGTLSRQETALYKGGKDTFSRYRAMRYGDETLIALAQAYVQYRNDAIDIKAGRQIFESFLTASNDTKMVPNTFLGYTFQATLALHTTLKVGYLTRQKLRDHEEFHHLLAYGYNGIDPLSAWSQNDDAAMHRGLTLQRLQERGIDDRMYVAEVKSNPFEDTFFRMNYTALPDLLSYGMVQIGHAWRWQGVRVTPSLRYMRQFDCGAGAIGGANLKTLVEGYDDPYSLDGWLVGVRTDIEAEAWRFRIAYTKVGDQGDIVAPWRGFPTGGFTRVMGQYNWQANTRTYMFQYDIDLDKINIVSGLKATVRVALQDFDDTKPGVQADSNVFEVGLREDFAAVPGTLVRLRWAHIDGDDGVTTPFGTRKRDPSADAVRLEFDYLF